jgi:UDP-GlcNAc:undecaprenyl-phosphate GlcNAc-1-phosphate transferase
VELVVGLIVALVLTPAAARAARAVGLVDAPGALKPQAQPVAYLGGVAVFAGIAYGVGVARVALLIPLGLALALGTLDDVRPLPARVRLAAEVVIGIVAGLVVPGPAWVGLATAGAVVVLLNAVNLLDGQDGLAAGFGIVAAGGFALLGGDATAVGLALVGALAGFLVYNRPPARIYLGDGGAYLLGTALALLPALTDRGDEVPVWIALPLLVALPLLDTAVAVLRRLLTGQPLFVGDRSHVYDQLADRGAGIAGSSAICVALQVPLSAAGVVAAGLGAAGALLVTVCGVMLLGVLAVAGRFVTPPAVEP